MDRGPVDRIAVFRANDPGAGAGGTGGVAGRRKPGLPNPCGPAGAAAHIYGPAAGRRVIDRDAMSAVADGYGPDVTVAVLGSHSALEIMDGAKDEGLRTAVVCERGREGPYRRFSRLADEIIVVDSFKDMLSGPVQERLRSLKAVVVPHRSLTAYLGYDAIEDSLEVPLFGNRAMLRAEERTEARGQYHLLRAAGIRHPRVYESPEEIDGPAIVKAMEDGRPLERAFFTVHSPGDYATVAGERVRAGIVSEAGLASASIEELVVGAYLNFNYFCAPSSDEVDFVGIERRLQTNVDGITSLPAPHLLGLLQGEGGVQLQNIEVGHTPASVRESLLGPVFEAGDRFAEAARAEYPPGVIGPFSLQSVVTKDLEIVVYDVSLRVPGNPILATTSPYTKYKYGETFGIGRRIAMEVRAAAQGGRLGGAVT